MAVARIIHPESDLFLFVETKKSPPRKYIRAGFIILARTMKRRTCAVLYYVLTMNEVPADKNSWKIS